MKFSRREVLLSALTTLSLLGLYRLKPYLNYKNNPIPGELLGASSNLGHQLKVNKFATPNETIKK